MQPGHTIMSNLLSTAEDVFFYADAAVADRAQRMWGDTVRSSHWLVREGTAKDLREVERIWRWLHHEGATRKSLLVCVGGGTVTDLGGFAAATFKRGIRYINIPTTLLAMVDASAGGKTGFDFEGVKNEIGSFYSPVDTLIDPSWLETLPYEEFLSGYAEMVKHALIADKNEYVRLVGSESDEDIESKIQASIRIKKNVVEQDPHESGWRKVLNFGHTVGHALEAHSKHNQRPLRHGYAVMQGMVAELYISVVEKGLDREVLRQMSHYLIEHYGRPYCGCSDYDSLLALMRSDKKNDRYGDITFTLLTDIGQPVINQVIPDARIKESLDYLFSL